MATYTSHYNLKKPATSDKIRIADFNGNADTIDATMYDNASLGAQLKADIGIVENTNTATHNISSGQYVIWKGSLYTASSAISSGATLSSANLTAVSGGGLNALNSNSFTQLDFTTTFKNYIGSNYDVYCVKYGKVCIVSGYFNISTVPTNNNIEIVNTGLSVYREAFFPFNDSDGYSVRSKIATSGKITNEALFAHTGWHTFSCIFIVN